MKNIGRRAGVRKKEDSGNRQEREKMYKWEDQRQAGERKQGRRRSQRGKGLQNEVIGYC